MTVRIVRPTKTPTVEIGSVACDNCEWQVINRDLTNAE